MARVFTGWNLDTRVGTGVATTDTPDRVNRPMVQTTNDHEFGEKRFLGTVIPANTDGVQSLRLALGTLVQPTTKLQFTNKTAPLPPKLLLHNDQRAAQHRQLQRARPGIHDPVKLLNCAALSSIWVCGMPSSR